MIRGGVTSVGIPFRPSIDASQAQLQAKNDKNPCIRVKMLRQRASHLAGTLLARQAAPCAGTRSMAAGHDLDPAQTPAQQKVWRSP